MSINREPTQIRIANAREVGRGDPGAAVRAAHAQAVPVERLNDFSSEDGLERWTRPDVGHLHLELTVIDPKFYTEPIHYQRTWLLGRPGQEVHEYACAEENVDAPHLQPGPGPIGPDGQRGYEKLAPLPPPPDKDHPAKTSIPD